VNIQRWRLFENGVPTIAITTAGGAAATIIATLHLRCFTER